MKIGNIELQNNIVLSPMAGITDLAFRIICKSMGAGLVVSEMVSSKGIYYEDKKTEMLLEVDAGERPMSVQIFGSDPKIMADIVKNHINSRDDIDIIDINMGCPAPKIVKNGDGSALMKNPEIIKQICKEVVKVSEKPVTIKIRTGWDDSSINCVEVAQIAEQQGISAVTVHGRTREMFYTGEANWDYIKQVKEAIDIPVIGNGDIFEPEDAIRMINETGCDAIAIGRGVKGNPWLFKRIIDRIEGRDDELPTMEEIIKLAIHHLYLITSIKGENIGVREMRKHIASYVKGLPNSTTLKDNINRVTTLKEVETMLWSYLEENVNIE